MAKHKLNNWHSCAAMELLERFVDLYGETPLQGSMVDPGMKLWRDYWMYTGEHMVLSDEGWEPADDVLESYADSLDEGQTLSDVLRDEVNWQFGLRKYDRIFAKRKARKFRPGGK